MKEALNQPFVQVALPLMLTMLLAVWTNNRRLDDIVGRLGKIEDRLLVIEGRLTAIERKVNTLELKGWR
jgi:hypothetical protein